MSAQMIDVYATYTQRCCDRWSVRIEGAEQMSEKELAEAAREAIQSGEADYVKSAWVENADDLTITEVSAPPAA